MPLTPARPSAKLGSAMTKASTKRTRKPLLDHAPSPDNKKLRDAMLKRIEEAENEEYDFTP